MKTLYILVLCLSVFSCQTNQDVIRIESGDSVFCQKPKKGEYLSIGIISRIPIHDRKELERLNYSRKDTIGFDSELVFIDGNNEECFFRAGTTFIGVCLGKDSLMTSSGYDMYLKIQPSECLSKLLDNSMKFKGSEFIFIQHNKVYPINQF